NTSSNIALGVSDRTVRIPQSTAVPSLHRNVKVDAERGPYVSRGDAPIEGLSGCAREPSNPVVPNQNAGVGLPKLLTHCSLKLAQSHYVTTRRLEMANAQLL
ncbi:MAG: hypothetical protein ACTHZ9_11185, partial [Leucobacter sp.]